MSLSFGKSVFFLFISTGEMEAVAILPEGERAGQTAHRFLQLLHHNGCKLSPICVEKFDLYSCYFVFSH